MLTGSRAASLQLASMLMTVRLQLRPRGALGHAGQLPTQSLHIVQLSIVLRGLLRALLWGEGWAASISLVKAPPASTFPAHTLRPSAHHSMELLALQVKAQLHGLAHGSGFLIAQRRGGC